MKKSLLMITPVAMLALAACNNTETPAESDAAGADTAEAPAEPVEMPPSITSKGTYRCADNTILYVEFFGENESASIRVGEETAEAIRVKPEAAEAPAEGTEEVAKPTGPMKSEDGETMLTGSGDQINVRLAGKGAQSCKK